MGLSRSAQMARIKSSDTKPERLLRSELWGRGLRYRLRHRVPAGRPDLVFPGRRVAVFVDGCFWHGCPDHYVPPRSRREYWEQKLAGNVQRDIFQTRQLEAAGWRVIRVWSCEIEASVVEVADRISSLLEDPRPVVTSAWRVLRVDWLDDCGEKEHRILVDLRDSRSRQIITRARSFLKHD